MKTRQFSTLQVVVYARNALFYVAVKRPNLELKTPAGFVAPHRHEVESFFRFQSQPTFYHKATEG
jgi:hypothetical protein